MPNSKEVTKNLLKDMVCERCVFFDLTTINDYTYQEVCTFSIPSTALPKERTCTDWVKNPPWYDKTTLIGANNRKITVISESIDVPVK